MRIPADKIWRGCFQGNYTGNIWQTRNIDLSTSPGRIGLADRMIIHNDDTDTNLSGLLTVTKFIRTDADATDRYWAVCGVGVTGGPLFKTASATPIATWAIDTLATDTTPPNVLDFEIHESANGEQRLLATTPTNVAILNKTGAANLWDVDWGTTVAAPAIVLTTGTLHPIARLQRLIAIGNGNVLQVIDKNDVVTNSRLIMPFGYSIRNIYASSDRYWIGCTNLIGTNAKIIEWDGFSLTYNNEYDVIGDIPLCGFIVANIPYFITNYGYIYRFSGGSFKVVQQFPLAEETLPTLDVSTYGSVVNSDKVYILADDNTGPSADITVSRKFRTGIWEFNTETLSLNHQRAMGASKTAGTDPDYGQSPLADTGGLLFAFTANSNVLMAGGRFYSAYSGTQHYAIWRTIQNKARYQSVGTNRGYFITTYILFDEVEAAWEGIWVKFKRFVDSSNRIVVKARVVDPKLLASGDLGATSSRMVVEKSGTWTTTTTFTSVVPTGVAVGDEVEVMSGNGAGCLAHITVLSAIPDNSATITVTVDDAIPSLNASGSRGALFRFDNWVKLGTISSTTIGSQKLNMPSAQHGEFVQFKIELRGFETEVDEIIPILKTLTKSGQA